jgi:hypothetical protein
MVQVAEVAKVAELFLTPAAILVGALGVARTEGLKTGVSALVRKRTTCPRFVSRRYCALRALALWGRVHLRCRGESVRSHRMRTPKMGD